MKAVLLALCAVLLLTAPSYSQVAVYRLSFSKLGQTINYKAYQDGYYIAPVGGGAGALILLQTGTGSSKVFYTFSNFGQSFVASSAGSQMMVISAVSTSTAANTTIYAIGEVNQQLSFEQTLATPASTTSTTAAATTGTTGTTATTAGSVVTNAQVAGSLRGYEITADSQSDMPFIGAGATQGVAGASSMTATLQQDMTSLALSENLTVAGQITSIENTLQQQGYTNGSSTTSTSSTTGTTNTGTTGTTTTGTTTTGG